MDVNEKVHFGEFDPKMVEIFEEYKTIIQDILPESEVILFGSNAVPMYGKLNEIDMLVIVDDQDKALPILEPIFPDVGIYDGRIYMHLYKGELQLEVHLVSKGHEKINRVLEMLEKFKTDEKLKFEMEELKKKYDGKTLAEYRDAKTNFFREKKLI